MLHIAVAVVVCAVFREGDFWRNDAAIADAERFLNMTDNALLFKGQNPADEIFDVGVRYLNIGWHRYLAPDAHAALLDLVGGLGESILLALVLRSAIMIL